MTTNEFQNEAMQGQRKSDTPTKPPPPLPPRHQEPKKIEGGFNQEGVKRIQEEVKQMKAAQTSKPLPKLPGQASTRTIKPLPTPPGQAAARPLAAAEENITVNPVTDDIAVEPKTETSATTASRTEQLFGTSKKTAPFLLGIMEGKAEKFLEAEVSERIEEAVKDVGDEELRKAVEANPKVNPFTLAKNIAEAKVDKNLADNLQKQLLVGLLVHNEAHEILDMTATALSKPESLSEAEGNRLVDFVLNFSRLDEIKSEYGKENFAETLAKVYVQVQANSEALGIPGDKVDALAEQIETASNAAVTSTPPGVPKTPLDQLLSNPKVYSVIGSYIEGSSNAFQKDVASKLRQATKIMRQSPPNPEKNLDWYQGLATLAGAGLVHGDTATKHASGRALEEALRQLEKTIPLAPEADALLKEMTNAINQGPFSSLKKLGASVEQKSANMGILSADRPLLEILADARVGKFPPEKAGRELAAIYSFIHGQAVSNYSVQDMAKDPKEAEGVKQVSDAINHGTFFLQRLILETKNKEELNNVAILTKTALDSMLESHNYSGLMAMNGALNGASIDRINEFFESPVFRKSDSLQKLKEAMDTSRAYAAFRRNYDRNPGCIPFVGVFNGDRTQAMESPDFLSVKTETGETKKEPNFNKMLNCGKILRAYGNVQAQMHVDQGNSEVVQPFKDEVKTWVGDKDQTDMDGLLFGMSKAIKITRDTPVFENPSTS